MIFSSMFQNGNNWIQFWTISILERIACCLSPPDSQMFFMCLLIARTCTPKKLSLRLLHHPEVFISVNDFDPLLTYGRLIKYDFVRHGQEFLRTPSLLKSTLHESHTKCRVRFILSTQSLGRRMANMKYEHWPLCIIPFSPTLSPSVTLWSDSNHLFGVRRSRCNTTCQPSEWSRGGDKMRPFEFSSILRCSFQNWLNAVHKASIIGGERNFQR